jgi:hypothetical protein
VAQFDHPLPVEDPLRAADGQVLPGFAKDSLANPAGIKVLLVSQPAGLGPFPNQGSFKLGRSAQYVQQKTRGRVLDVGIQPLGDGDKPGKGVRELRLQHGHSVRRDVAADG